MPCNPISAPAKSARSLDWITIQNIDAMPRVISANAMPLTRGSTTPNSRACKIAAARTTSSAVGHASSAVLSMMPKVYAPTAKNIAWPNDSNPVTPRIRS